MVFFGILFSKRQRTLEEYFHASSNIPWWAAGISILATGLSPISYLAGPGWIFEKDSRNSIVSSLVGLALIPVSVAIWVPLWSRLRVMSIYQYLQQRYHSGVRIFGALLFLVGTTFWLGTALVTSAMGFESATGFPGQWCLVIMVILGTAYTMMGGIRAVIWTDVAQYIIFMIGYLAILIVLLMLFDCDRWRFGRSPQPNYPRRPVTHTRR